MEELNNRVFGDKAENFQATSSEDGLLVYLVLWMADILAFKE